MKSNGTLRSYLCGQKHKYRLAETAKNLANVSGKCSLINYLGYMLMKLARWLLAAYDVSSNSVVPNVPFEPFVDTALLFRRRLRTERSVCRRTVPLLVFTWDTTRVPRYHDGLRRRPELFPVCEVHLGVKRLDESHLTEIHISLIEFSVCNLDFVLDSIIDENRINVKRKKNTSFIWLFSSTGSQSGIASVIVTICL